MRDAVIVSTARTPIGRAYRGAFNNTDSPTLGGHAIRHAVSRAGIDPTMIGDVYMGCSMGQGTQGKMSLANARWLPACPLQRPE